MQKVDFSQVDENDSSFEPVPIGTYPIEITAVEYGATRAKDDMIKMTLEITAGDHQGRVFFDNLVFSEKAISRVKTICRALGFDVDSTDIGLQEVSRETLLGKRAIVSVEIQEYEGKDGDTKTRNKVPWKGWSPTAADAKARAAAPVASSEAPDGTIEGSDAPSTKDDDSLPF